MKNKHKTILYIEDDTDDQELLIDCIKAVDPGVEIVIAGNGLLAMEFLAGSKKLNGNLPGLIVLDINMPFIDGKEVFDKIRADFDLKKIPVIVFSSSEKPGDKSLFNEHGVLYFNKPNSTSNLTDIAKQMISFCI